MARKSADPSAPSGARREAPLCLLILTRAETAAFARLDARRQRTWWERTLPTAITHLERQGARRVALARTTWSSEWHHVLVLEFDDLPALERGVDALGDAGLFRHLDTVRIVGRRWGGEAGWDADRWRSRAAHAQLAGVLFYRISESLYTLTPEEMTARHDRRRALLNRAVDDLVAAGGQRLGAYFTEWSSEWHLIVAYEFPDLAALEAFNRAMPERHGYLDYDVVFIVGDRIEPQELRRP